ncbi:MAG: class I SAM-dependent methyltransferase [Coriobacteriales bacterium]|nr:class I SAM-dependent methyltransferase [Coriobacteriales bacterium]
MKDYGNGALAMWNGWSRSRAGIPANDPWLEHFEDDLEARRGEVFLDLGCGTGADTLWLLEHGYDVLSADYAREALRSIERNLPGGRTAYVDMRRPLPFADGSFGAVVSSMALHYFDEATTVRLMDEVRRIIAPGGILLARVSNVNDVTYGAGSGREVETRYYDHGSYAQRYLDEGDVRRFFGAVGELEFFEGAMTRPEAYYSRPKMMWTIRAERTQA